MSQPRFPVIGIGASAGGLDALERFLGPVSRHPGQAFVVVQHCGSSQQSRLAELLQRRCALPVREARRGMSVEVDHVYVLLQDAEQRNPIDEYFITLAHERREAAVGVLLSGMGRDGVDGLRAIQDYGGLTAAQAPDSAQHDSMPRAAIDAGVVDCVATADRLYETLHARVQQRSDVAGLDTVLTVLQERTGHDFSQYKRQTLWRRTARRLQERGVRGIEAYTELLRHDASEADALFHTLLIGETRFFRDAESWQQLAQHAVPAILAAHPTGGVIRAWVAGCSTGEEAYSMAIVFREALEALTDGAKYRVQIFATDVDPQAIEKARQARYPLSIAGDVSPERLERFFVRDGEAYRPIKAIRELVVLATQNVIADPPFTRLDLVSCRNVLIYFAKEQQQRLLSLFHYCLRPNGLLFLGSAESTGATSVLFAPFAQSMCLHRRVAAPLNAAALDAPVNQRRRKTDLMPETDPVLRNLPLREQLERAVLERLAPTALLVNGRGEILETMGDVGRFTGRHWNDAGQPTLGRLLTTLGTALLTGLATSMREQRSVRLDDIRVPVGSRELRLRATIDPVQAGAGASFAVLLDDNAPRNARSDELESINEELTSSRDELQSLNAELRSVNQELQARLGELTRASDDMVNLLESTRIATLFLDSTLRVRRYTAKTTELFKLIPTDVGRPITDLASALDFPELATAAQEVLRSLVVDERDVRTHDGRRFLLRIMPYRTQDDAIDGLVLTFSEVGAMATNGGAR